MKIIYLLRELGADISYHDPYVDELPEFELRSADLDAALADTDVAVISTAHPEIDY